MRWCSSPECTYALKAEEDLMKAECICGKVICFKCGRDWHDPLQCHLLDKWMLKYTTDSENAHYIVAHTKVQLLMLQIVAFGLKSAKNVTIVFFTTRRDSIGAENEKREKIWSGLIVEQN